MENRILSWNGSRNVRDLGGLRTGDGRMTRWKAIVRSDTPARLTESGWAALYQYGIRTIITLHTHGMTENELTFTSPYPDVVTIQLAIEDVTNMGFVKKWASTDFWCTPLYYKDALQLWPERHAAVISAVAQAQPGGVLFHCVRGHDRTGIISLLLLTLAGVVEDDIVADYELSLDPERDELLASVQSSTRDALRATLAGFDVENYFQAGGASQADLAAVRNRLLQ